MNQSRYTQQITVLEMLNDIIKEDTDKAIDQLQIIENLLYVKNRHTLKQYLEKRL